jgi:hypothetical protein
MRQLLTILAICLLAPATLAGVVIETEVMLAEAPEKSGTEFFYAQGEMTRADYAAPGGADQSVIFRDQTMYFLDHGKKLCQTIDRKSVDELARQLEVAMKQLEGLPAEQREMMEKMMAGKMPGMQKLPVRRFEEGGTAQVGNYSCNLVTMYSDEKKTQEVCLADADVIADLAEAMDAVHALSRFAESLMKMAANMPFGDVFELPYFDQRPMEGFPIRSRTFDDAGAIVRESTVTSVTREEIDTAVFEIPDDYKVQNLEKQLKKGR